MHSKVRRQSFEEIRLDEVRMSARRVRGGFEFTAVAVIVAGRVNSVRLSAAEAGNIMSNAVAQRWKYFLIVVCIK